MIKVLQEVSIIIPTHNRSDSLMRTLGALSNQSYPLSHIEVVVVADGCTDETIQLLEKYEAKFNLKYVEQPSQGPAIARNSGSEIARSNLLIFLDDDIEADPDLVSVHVEAHQVPNRVVIGYLPPVLAVQKGFFKTELRGWWEAMFQPMKHNGYRYNYTNLLSGNFSISANMFSQVGGFNAAFRCHEDYELGLRLINAGTQFYFASNALGWHHEMTQLKRSFQRKYQEGLADVQLGKLYPDLITELLLFRMNEHYSKPIFFLPYQLLLFLIFHDNKFSDAIARAFSKLLGPLESFLLQRQWRQLLYLLLGYWYLRGVAYALGYRQALSEFLKQPLKASATQLEIEIDLCNGIVQAECQLNQKRPSSIKLCFGDTIIGQLPHQPGAEKLRADHLLPALSRDLSSNLLKVLFEQAEANEQVLGFPLPTSKEIKKILKDMARVD